MDPSKMLTMQSVVYNLMVYKTKRPQVNIGHMIIGCLGLNGRKPMLEFRTLTGDLGRFFKS